eukprot:2973406-Rhodomonas_salina.1
MAGHQKRLALDRFDKNSFIAIDHSERLQIDSQPWFSVDGPAQPDDADPQDEEHEEIDGEGLSEDASEGADAHSSEKSEL